MEMTKKGFKISYFALGVLFLVLSFYTFSNPAINLVSIIIIFGMLAIYKGVIELVANVQAKQVKGIVVGVVDLIVGIYLLLHIFLGLILLPYVFAIWFTVDSIILLTNHLKHEQKNGLHWLLVVLDIVGIVIGLSLFLDPIVSALTLSLLVSIYILLAGVNYMITSFR